MSDEQFTAEIDGEIRLLRPGITVELRGDGSAIENGQYFAPGTPVAASLHNAAGGLALDPVREETEAARAFPDSLIDPQTLRTGRHQRLLDTLMEWTSDERIIAGLMRSGVQAGTIVPMVGYIKMTYESKGQTGLSERQMAAHIIHFFLGTRDMRKVIAGYVHRTYGRERRHAMRDLADLRKELLTDFGIRE